MKIYNAKLIKNSVPICFQITVIILLDILLEINFLLKLILNFNSIFFTNVLIIRIHLV